MPPDSKDMARLWDMLDAARTVVAFTNSLRFEDFVNDRKTRNAVERNPEIIGEAARNVSDATREWLNVVPWRSIIGLRNVLAHEYGDIRQEIIWAVIQDKITPLIQQLESAGADAPPSAAHCQLTPIPASPLSTSRAATVSPCTARAATLWTKTPTN